MQDLTTESPKLALTEDNLSLACSGAWTLSSIRLLEKQFSVLTPILHHVETLQMQHITQLDTAGAFFLNKIIQFLNQNKTTITLTGAKSIHLAVLEFVQKQTEDNSVIPKPSSKKRLFLLGKWSIDKLKQVLNYLSFLGELIFSFLRLWQKPENFRWRYVFKVIEDVGCGSLPIIALMSFLIGVVLAYQLAVELQYYGATIYVIDASGIALLREFSPLITAIIMAGKTTTAFAALIGTMKINEEIDALETMGVSPMQRLVLPRIVALLIVMPLLTVWSCLWGVFGSMVMSRSILSIDFNVFLQRFVDVVEFYQYGLGMIKTPVFALIVALVGCFQGFQVSMSADSVGQKTTRAAVQAIFLIIIADAIFSVLYSWKGL